MRHQPEKRHKHTGPMHKHLIKLSVGSEDKQLISDSNTI